MHWSNSFIIRNTPVSSANYINHLSFMITSNFDEFFTKKYLEKFRKQKMLCSAPTFRSAIYSDSFYAKYLHWKRTEKKRLHVHE